jgi:lipoprotein-releasing system permease protein
MLGVAILIIVMSVMNGFRVDLTDKIIGLNPHIIVQFNNVNEINKIKKKISKAYDDIDIVESTSGEGIILTNNKAKGILIKGISKKDKSQSFLNKEITKGNLNDFSAGKIMIGGELAYNLNLKVGDKINIVSSSFVDTPFGSVPKQDDYKIAGFFNSGFYEFDQNLIYLELDDSRSILNVEKDNVDLELFLPDPFLAEKYKKEIENLSKNIFVSTWSDTNKSFFNALKVERNVMFIILTLIIVVAAFNIISGLTILIKNKTKEIAIIKTLGLSENSIIRSFFLTGFTIGFLATVTGVFFGVIFSIYIDEIRNTLSMLFGINIFPSDVYYLEKMPSEVNVVSVGIVFILSLFITSLASYFPAKTISNMKTTEALKYE